jgi:hypothetical protein
MLPQRGEMHVILNDAPCCKKELESFLEILSTSRSKIIGDEPFFLLYNLTRCKYNRDHVAAQEKILSGATACAIISNSALVRSAIKVATAVPKVTKIKIFATTAAGLTWLRQFEDENQTNRTAV